MLLRLRPIPVRTSGQLHAAVLTAIQSIKAYPETLRRITYVDPETLKRFRSLTNSFVLPALTIARIYKPRGQVELFFKWIKSISGSRPFTGPPRTR